MAYSMYSDYLIEMSMLEMAKLTGNTSGTTTVNADRLNYAIANADEEINGYLKGRYNVPFEDVLTGNVPQLIKSLSISLTFAFLYSYTYPRTIVPLNITNRRSQAIEILKKLQNGEMYLKRSIITATAPPSIISNKSNYTKPLNTLLEGY